MEPSWQLDIQQWTEQAAISKQQFCSESRELQQDDRSGFGCGMRAVCCREDGSMPHIYLKREDLNHTGAHKINNALGQAMLCKRMGKNRIIAETGAGQHGVATVSDSCSWWVILTAWRVLSAASRAAAFNQE